MYYGEDIYIYWRSVVAGRIQLVKLLSVCSSRLKLSVRQRTRARGVVWFGKKQKDGYHGMGIKQFESSLESSLDS